MEKTKAQKVGTFFAYLSGLLASLGVIISFLGWLFYPHIEDAIMDIVEKNKGESTKTLLSKEMSTPDYVVPAEDVCEELGDMFKDNKHRHDAQDAILDLWIPYLEEEIKWRAVGYFVDPNRPDVVKFRHWDGRNYDAWSDEQGWFYIKGGYKYYH